MKHIISILFICLSNMTSQAQNSPSDLNRKFVNYLTSSLSESIYLQTDKPYYTTEDTIWLKAYVVNAQIYQPSPSNFVYIELINQLDSVERRIKIRKENNAFSGYLALDKKLIPGEYALRAYTNWMRNDSPDYFFQKNISISKVIQNPKILTAKFYPAKENKQQALIQYTYSDGSPIKNCRIDFAYNRNGKKYRKRYALTDSKGEIELQIQQQDRPTEKQQLSATVFDNKGGIIYEQKFAIPERGEDFDVQFFPESGILLAGTPQTVAFKAIGADGLSTSVSGKVFSAGGTFMADITTLHNGMGKFPLLAQKDSIYLAIITDNKGIEKQFRLPKVQEKGITLQLRQQGETCIYMLENNTNFPTDSLLIIAHTRGIPSIVKPLTTNNKTGKFSLSQVPEGILNVAITNQTGRVFCERMMYIKKETHITPRIQTDQAAYGQREKVEMQISLPGNGDFALSVTDAQLIKWDSLENNISTQLLMKSELRGHIESPNYYFTANTTQINEHLDLLMLTQGWKKYDLSSILQEHVPQPQHPMEIGQSLTGKVKPLFWKSMNGIEVVGFSNHWKAVHAQVDSVGNYFFNGIEFPDSTAFTINAINKRGKAKGVMIYPDAEVFPDSKTFIPAPKGVIQERTQSAMDEYHQIYRQNNIWKEIMLDEIHVTAKYISKTGKLAGEFAGYADYVITDRMIEAEYKNKSVWDIVYENIILKTPGIGKLTEDQYIYRGKELRFVVDMNLVESTDLQYYMASEIASISFFRDAQSVPVYVPNAPFLKGAEWQVGPKLKESNTITGGVSFKEKIEEGWKNDANENTGWKNTDFQKHTAEMDKYKGVILIELKNGGSAHYYRPSLGLATLYPLGYQKPAEFYSPQYDVPDSLQTDKTDFRTTIYWNPQIQTDSTGRTKVSFYTTDMNHDMEYVLEGITENGVPCRVTGRIKTK